MFRDVPECSGMFHVPDFIDGLPKIANFTGKLWDGLLFPRQLIRGNSCTARVYKFFVHQPLLLITSVFFANS